MGLFNPDGSKMEEEVKEIHFREKSVVERKTVSLRNVGVEKK